MSIAEKLGLPVIIAVVLSACTSMSRDYTRQRTTPDLAQPTCKNNLTVDTDRPIDKQRMAYYDRVTAGKTKEQKAAAMCRLKDLNAMPISYAEFLLLVKDDPVLGEVQHGMSK